MLTQTKPLTCLISAPAGTDLSVLLAILKERQIQVLNPVDFAPYPARLADQLLATLHHADLAIGVLDEAAASSDVIFELGCATALGKKVFVLVLEKAELSSNLRSLPQLRTRLEEGDRDLIEFALEQMLNLPNLAEKPVRPLTGASQPLGAFADELLQQLNELLDTPLHLSLEKILQIVQIVFDASQVLNRDKSLKSHDSGFDFGIWVPELEPYFGNPIPVDIKLTLTTSSAVKAATDCISKRMSSLNMSAAILLVVEISPGVEKILEKHPDIYAFSLTSLVEKLKHKSIGEILRDERNARVHGLAS